MLSGSEYFQQICKELEGYSFQVKGNKTIDVYGNKCYLSTKYDAIDPNRNMVKDLKTTKSYSKDKYLKGFQHKLYCYVSGLDEFEYIIAEWDEFPIIKAVYKEVYSVSCMQALEDEIKETISENLDLLKILGFWSNYRENFCLY